MILERERLFSLSLSRTLGVTRPLPHFDVVGTSEEMLFRHPLVHDEVKGTRPLGTGRGREEIDHVLEIILNQMGEDHDQTLLHGQDLRA